jgi:hypothetical protein
MVHLETLHRQEEDYEKHKKEILSSGHRYAVIPVFSVSVEYFDSRESLYEKHPYFNPSGPHLYGTLPMLVDIGKETNSLEYQKEKLAEGIEEFNNGLVDILERGDRLAEKERKLQEIEEIAETAERADMAKMANTAKLGCRNR